MSRICCDISLQISPNGIFMIDWNILTFTISDTFQHWAVAKNPQKKSLLIVSVHVNYTENWCQTRGLHPENQAHRASCTEPPLFSADLHPKSVCEQSAHCTPFPWVKLCLSTRPPLPAVEECRPCVLHKQKNTFTKSRFTFMKERPRSQIDALFTKGLSALVKPISSARVSRVRSACARARRRFTVARRPMPLRPSTVMH